MRRAKKEFIIVSNEKVLTGTDTHKVYGENKVLIDSTDSNYNITVVGKIDGGFSDISMDILFYNKTMDMVIEKTTITTGAVTGMFKLPILMNNKELVDGMDTVFHIKRDPANDITVNAIAIIDGEW